MGLVQAREPHLFNRFEHLLAGLFLFYGFYLLKFAHLFPIKFIFPWMGSFFIFLLVNLAMVIHEIVELFLDKAFKVKLLIGPGIYDTNIDLLMTFLGGLIAFLVQVYFTGAPV